MPILGKRKKRFKEAQLYNDSGEYSSEEKILIDLWQESPEVYEVYEALLTNYKLQEKWVLAEDLINKYSIHRSYESFINWEMLKLKLAMKRPELAFIFGQKIIEEYPEDHETALEVGSQFYNEGFGDDFLQFIDKIDIPCFDNVSIKAQYLVSFQSDYEKAITLLQEELKKPRANTSVNEQVEFYNREWHKQKTSRARNILYGLEKGNSVSSFKELFDQNQNSVVAQEYYLVALACHYFPPFRFFFHNKNIVAMLPYVAKATLFMFFFFLCSIYFKGGLAENEIASHRLFIMIIGSLIVIRYAVFPAVIQLIGLVHIKGYHLLKRPYNFIVGMTILLVWARILYLGNNGNFHGFEYMIAGAIMINIIMIFLTSEKEKSLSKSLLLLYLIPALFIGYLAFIKLLPDVYLFFAFAGWLPPIIANTILAFYTKVKSAYILIKEAPEENHGHGLTLKVHIVSACIAIITFGCAFLFLRYPLSIHGCHVNYFLIPFLIYFITIFGMTEPNFYDTSFGYLIKYNKKFLLLFTLLSMGLYISAILMAKVGNVILRESTSWIFPCILFLISWFGLMLLNRLFSKNRAKPAIVEEKEYENLEQ